MLLPIGRNGKVSIESSTTHTITLSAVDAAIGPPQPKDMQVFGGIVHYVILLDPLTDFMNCMAGDTLYIKSFPPHSVNPDRQYYVFQAEPEGIGALAVCRLVVGTRQMGG